jgi:hypothetical protein
MLKTPLQFKENDFLQREGANRILMPPATDREE